MKVVDKRMREGRSLKRKKQEEPSSDPRNYIYVAFTSTKGTKIKVKMRIIGEFSKDFKEEQLRRLRAA